MGGWRGRRLRLGASLALLASLAACDCSSYAHEGGVVPLDTMEVGGREVTIAVRVTGRHGGAGTTGSSKLPTGVHGGYDSWQHGLETVIDENPPVWRWAPPERELRARYLRTIDEGASVDAQREQAMADARGLEVESCADADRGVFQVSDADGPLSWGWVGITIADGRAMIAPLADAYEGCEDALRAVPALERGVEMARDAGEESACHWLDELGRPADALRCALVLRPLQTLDDELVERVRRGARGRPDLEEVFYDALARPGAVTRESFATDLLEAAPSHERRSLFARNALARCEPGPPGDPDRCDPVFARLGSLAAARGEGALADDAVSLSRRWLAREDARSAAVAMAWANGHLDTASEAERRMWLRAAFAAPVPSPIERPFDCGAGIEEGRRCGNPPLVAAVALSETCPEDLVADALRRLREAPAGALVARSDAASFPWLRLAIACDPDGLDRLLEDRGTPEARESIDYSLGGVRGTGGNR